MWNSGRVEKWFSWNFSSGMPIALARSTMGGQLQMLSRPVTMMDHWFSITPLLRPVVPEVNMIMERALGSAASCSCAGAQPS